MIYRTASFRIRLFQFNHYKILGKQNFLNSSPKCPIFWAWGEIVTIETEGIPNFPSFVFSYENETLCLPDIWEVRNFLEKDGDKIVSILVEGKAPLEKGLCWQRDIIKRYVFVLAGSYSPYQRRKKCFEKFWQYFSPYLGGEKFGLLEIKETDWYSEKYSTLPDEIRKCAYSIKNFKNIKFHDYVIHSRSREDVFIGCDFRAILIPSPSSPPPEIYFKDREKYTVLPQIVFLIHNPSYLQK